MLWNALLIIAGCGLLASTVFVVLALIAARRFRGRVLPHRDASQLGITVLKPLHGAESGLEINLESFFLQNYPQYEIIFAARDERDAALPVVDRLRRRYPHIPTKVVLSGEPPYPNAKVFSLEAMLAQATYDYIVISDSDVRVGPDYLTEVVRPLTSPEVGMVTCLYRGLPTGGLWARLEALGMSVEMTSGVVTADMLEGTNFAMVRQWPPAKIVWRRSAGSGCSAATALTISCSDARFLTQVTASCFRIT